MWRNSPGFQMTTKKSDRSGASARTRLAILRAAAPLLARNPTATMAEIAEAAATVRSTVHRHFPERADLIAALRAHTDEQMAKAAVRARLEDGSAVSALLRLCTEYFENADFIWAAYDNLTQDQEIESVGTANKPLKHSVERGHDDGSIDPALPPEWIEQALWSLLYAAWLLAAAGQASKHEALRLQTHSNPECDECCDGDRG
jgi:AcrR family transcriptional regulator